MKALPSEKCPIQFDMEQCILYWKTALCQGNPEQYAKYCVIDTIEETMNFPESPAYVATSPNYEGVSPAYTATSPNYGVVTPPYVATSPPYEGVSPAYAATSPVVSGT